MSVLGILLFAAVCIAMVHWFIAFARDVLSKPVPEPEASQCPEQRTREAWGAE